MSVCFTANAYRKPAKVHVKLLVLVLKHICTTEDAYCKISMHFTNVHDLIICTTFGTVNFYQLTVVTINFYAAYHAYVLILQQSSSTAVYKITV